MNKDVVLGQVSVHQVALLVQLAHCQHQLRVEDLHLLLRHLCILQYHISTVKLTCHHSTVNA